MQEEKEIDMSDTLVPKELGEIGGWTYAKLYKERPTFCKRLLKFRKSTGFFLEFKQFCLRQSKH